MRLLDPLARTFGLLRPRRRRAGGSLAETQSLEQRALLTVILDQGVLTIESTSGSDTISVTEQNGQVEATENGTTTSFPAGDVQSVVIRSFAGQDVVTLSGLTVPGEVLGGQGADSITGGDADDTLSGGDGKDTIIGGGGDDVISGGGQNDVVKGGTGDDTFVWATGDGLDVVNGGSGADTQTVESDPGAPQELLVDMAATTTQLSADGTVLVQLADNVEELSVTAGSDEDRMTVEALPGTGLERLSVDLSTSNDRFDARDLEDVKVTVMGGSGDDNLIGTAGSDVLNGEGGNDLIRGRAGDDTVIGGTGDDVVIGGGGDDVARGQRGNDDVRGGNGNDLVFGGTEFDTLSGGAGHDFLRGAEDPDFISGGGGDDTLQGVGGEDELRGGDGNDLLAGGSQDDTLLGGRGHDTMIGGDGNDLIVGANGRDNASGGDGRDLLVGGMNRDTLAGDAGDDLLIAGQTTKDPAQLTVILSEWTSARDYDQRVANIRKGEGRSADRANGEEYLVGRERNEFATVLNDFGDIDQLIGDADQDYFFLAEGLGDDDINDRMGTERDERI